MVFLLLVYLVVLARYSHLRLHLLATDGTINLNYQNMQIAHSKHQIAQYCSKQPVQSSLRFLNSLKKETKQTIKHNTITYHFHYFKQQQQSELFPFQPASTFRKNIPPILLLLPKTAFFSTQHLLKIDYSIFYVTKITSPTLSQNIAEINISSPLMNQKALREIILLMQRSGFDNVLIIFMKEDTADFPTLRMNIPPYKEMKDIHSFLQKDKSTPFRKFFLTHRPKERLIYKEESEFKDIRKDLKLDSANNYVLLCYEEKTQAPEEVSATVNAEPKKEGGCIVM